MIVIKMDIVRLERHLEDLEWYIDRLNKAIEELKNAKDPIEQARAQGAITAYIGRIPGQIKYLKKILQDLKKEVEEYERDNQ